MVHVPSFVFPLLTAVAVAQTGWRHLEILTPRQDPALAALPGGPLTLFGGAGPIGQPQTWEWNGATWTRRLTGTVPSGPGGYLSVADSRRNRLVVVALLPAGIETWTWDGRDWRQLGGAQPTGGIDGVMVYDSARDRVVLPGSYATNVVWEFDGSAWRQVSPATWPGRRNEPAMAYDARLQRAVLLKGDGFGMSDTWLWDGVDWSFVSTGSRQPDRQGAAMAFDPRSGRTIVYGGLVGTTPRSDMWAFDGQTWTQIAANSAPGPRSGAQLAYDATTQRLILHGGGPFASEPQADTWAFDGSSWRQLVASAAPSKVLRAAMSALPAADGVVLYQGASEYYGTWVLRGSDWVRVPSATSPSSNSGHAMALDSARGRVVLFGGSPAINRYVDETWEWDGGQWKRHQPTVAPTARRDHAMAFDAVRGRTVLFGGGVFGTWFGDTWEYDGGVWQQVTTANAPSPRSLHGMAYDEARREVVLFGGQDAGGANRETWTYDGNDWTRRRPATVPAVTFGYAAMVYDAARERVVLAQGDGAMWEWDGVDWARRAGNLVIDQVMPNLAYDPAQGEVVAIGGLIPGGSETYRYGPLDPALANRYGSACGPTPQPALALADGRLPWRGDSLRLRASPLAASARAAAFVLGASDRSWNGVALPLDLGFLGMRGCSLLASADAAVAVPVVAGAASLATSIPDTRAVVGLTVFGQVVAPAPGANLAGLVTTDALALRIGSR